MRTREIAPLIAAATVAAVAILVVLAITVVQLLPTLDDDLCITNPSAARLHGSAISQQWSDGPVGIECTATAADGSTSSVVIGPGWWPIYAASGIFGVFLLAAAGSLLLVWRARKGRPLNPSSL